MNSRISPDLTVLFIIDGMACGTLERLPLPMLRKLRDDGVYFPDLALPLPAHLQREDDPNSAHYYPWGCSLPNVILQTGSLFVGSEALKESMIQHSFPQGTTAFVVNESDYLELRHGYTFYVRHGREEGDVFDYDGVLKEARQLLTRHCLRFLRIHLQGPGTAGYLDKQAGCGLWSDQSMYGREMVRADAALADFIAWLRETNCLDRTALIVMGDHGQNDEGWHSPYVGQAHKQPVLFCGAGIKKGKTMRGASSLDIAPTICHMNQVDLPSQNMGRILYQVLEGQGEEDFGTCWIERLNQALLQHHQLLKQQTPEFQKLNQEFCTIEGIGSWHRRFSQVQEVVLHNEQILHELVKITLSL